MLRKRKNPYLCTQKSDTMKSLRVFILCLSCLAISIYACKKEELNSEDVVKSKFIGKWPLKKHIEINLKNGDTISKDTTTYLPIDTLVFTTEGKYIKAGTTVDYTIDPSGEKITYSTAPPTTWTIKFLRINSIILTNSRTETIAGNLHTYYIEEQLIK